MPNIYVPTLSLHDAVARFRKAGIPSSETKIAAGIEQGVYPFGICIRFEGRNNRSFEIYAKLLDEYLSARAVQMKET